MDFPREERMVAVGGRGWWRWEERMVAVGEEQHKRREHII
jgi:hypothetical protein